jgi:hypothetical protein
VVPFVGPGGAIRTKEADVRRLINLYLKPLKPGSGKADFILEETPGLTEFSDLGAEVRGCHTSASGVSYWVAGNKAYKLAADGTETELGTLLSSTGPVEFGENTTQICMVDGDYGYVVTQATDAFERITSSAFYGSKTIAVIDGYGLFVRPDTGQFFISANNDFLAYDALDFATSEGSPDNAIAVVADHRQARIFNSKTTEGWFNSGDPDFPFSRDQSSYSQIGSISPYAVRAAANSVVFLGNSEEGPGVVYMATGNQVERVSTAAEELALQASTDLTEARAYVYQSEGHMFYCLNAPGMETTLVFDLSTREWHERAELVSGAYEPHRAVCHSFAHGYHLLGAENGKVYRLDRTVNTHAGDPKPRRRISPHNWSAANEEQFFGAFELVATKGDAPSGVVPVVQLRYSNDGGKTWQGWRERELGRIGEHSARVRWEGMGRARDRVWDVSFTGDAPFSIISASCPVGVGNG